MAIVSLQAESVRANPTECEILYRVWRYAMAKWELAENDPANSEGLPQEQADAFCDIEMAALMDFFLTPAANIADVARKVRVVREHAAWELDRADEIFKRLQRDTHRLAHGVDPCRD